MTRKHFELIAKTLRELPPGATKSLTVERLADALKTTNPNFKRERFIEAASAPAFAKAA